MEPQCYLYGQHGWLSRTGQYVSDITSAKSFDLPEAITLTLRHKSQDGFGLVPVRVEDLP